MEFRYRAGDAPNPSTRAMATSVNPESTATRVQGYYGGNGSGFREENSEAVAPRPAQDELRRQAAKDRIRERILQEEVETLALEAEVRRELMEELIPSLRRSTGACACGKGSEAKATPVSVSSSLETMIGHKVRSKPNASAAALLPAKRKISCVVAAASTISAAASSEKQKQGLTCMLCGIRATGEKGMQDHLKGKAHTSNAATLVQKLPEKAVEHGRLEDTEEEGAYTPSKLNIVTNTGTMCEVVQMNGYLLCEVCYVKAPDFITMRCHLEGGKHISKAKQQEEQSQAVVAATDASVDPEIETVDVKVNGMRRVDGLLLCEFCDVKAASQIVMRSHLAGKKHASKQKAAIDAGAGGKAVLAQPKTDKDVAVETSTAPGQQAKIAEATATVGDSNKSVVLDVSGVQHVVEKVDGFLICSCCKVKAPSECVMRSHLVGKKHKSKAKVGALGAGAGGKRSVLAEAKSKEAASVVVDGTGRIEGQGNDEPVERSAVEHMEAVPLASPQQDATAPVCASFSVAPMEVDERAEAGDDAAKAEEEKVDAKEEEAVETNGVAAVAGQEVKIQVEGKLFTVLRQADSSLSCGLCALHGCGKDRMLKHLYTREHWHRARISEQNEEQARKVVVSNDSDGVVIPVTDGA